MTKTYKPTPQAEQNISASGLKGRSEIIMGLTRKTCRCVANVDGRCVAEKCEGAVVAFDVKICGPEEAKEFYELIKSLMKEDFP